eukprot:scaffold11985_cov112-Isochrysis_galbana.AAC.2
MLAGHAAWQGSRRTTSGAGLSPVVRACSRARTAKLTGSPGSAEAQRKRSSPPTPVRASEKPPPDVRPTDPGSATAPPSLGASSSPSGNPSTRRPTPVAGAAVLPSVVVRASSRRMSAKHWVTAFFSSSTDTQLNRSPTAPSAVHGTSNAGAPSSACGATSPAAASAVLTSASSGLSHSRPITSRSSEVAYAPLGRLKRSRIPLAAGCSSTSRSSGMGSRPTRRPPYSTDGLRADSGTAGMKLFQTEASSSPAAPRALAIDAPNSGEVKLMSPAAKAAASASDTGVAGSKTHSVMAASPSEDCTIRGLAAELGGHTRSPTHSEPNMPALIRRTRTSLKRADCKLLSSSESSHCGSRRRPALPTPTRPASTSRERATAASDPPLPKRWGPKKLAQPPALRKACAMSRARVAASLGDSSVSLTTISKWLPRSWPFRSLARCQVGGLSSLKPAAVHRSPIALRASPARYCVGSSSRGSENVCVQMACRSLSPAYPIWSGLTEKMRPSTATTSRVVCPSRVKVT